MSPAPIRLVTWNVRKAVGLDWRRDPARILHVLGETGAGIALIQEADRRLAPRRPALPLDMLAAAGWTAVDTDPATPSIGHHGNAVLLRGGWSAVGTRRVDLPGLEPRGALAARLERRGDALGVASVHLGLRRRDRRRQMAALALALADLGARAILAGDTNEWGRTALLPLPEGWAWHVAGPSFHAARPVMALDRVATGPDAPIGGLHVHRSAAARRASDHLPVVFALGAAP